MSLFTIWPFRRSNLSFAEIILSIMAGMSADQGFYFFGAALLIVALVLNLLRGKYSHD